jgi:hypothetical protein
LDKIVGMSLGRRIFPQRLKVIAYKGNGEQKEYLPHITDICDMKENIHSISGMLRYLDCSYGKRLLHCLNKRLREFF